MSEAPRAVARPLDDVAAANRARQLVVLSEPSALRALSAVASSAGGAEDPAVLAASVGQLPGAFAVALQELQAVDLLAADADGVLQLTAEAWVRFGRMLTADAARPVVAAAMPAPAEPLPSAIERVVDDLSYRFSSTFSRETVAGYVGQSYALLEQRAHITQHLPSLTARFSTERLSALASASGLRLAQTPEVLFVCVQNAGRSQMAAAMLRHLAGDRVHVRTAGSAPAATIAPMIVEVLDEIGVPLASEFPKPLTDEVVQAADYVVTMGCGDACPVYPGRRYMDWPLPDPVGRSLEEVRSIRDEIAQRVRVLIEEMALRR